MLQQIRINVADQYERNTSYRPLWHFPINALINTGWQSFPRSKVEGYLWPRKPELDVINDVWLEQKIQILSSSDFTYDVVKTYHVIGVLVIGKFQRINRVMLCIWK